jgi:hypothetical protein
MLWINGLYTYCPLNKLLWCSDSLVAQGDKAQALRIALTDGVNQWLPIPRKPTFEATRMRDQFADLASDVARDRFQDRRWDMPTQDRYDRPRNDELLTDDDYTTP